MSRRHGALRNVLNELFFLGLIGVIAAILTTAMILQYWKGELPCPLCLLQRAAMIGICFGPMLNFRHGYSDRNLGFSLLFAVFLLIVSVRQTLLDIYPRPGHAYVGTEVLDLHMPVWSALIAVATIAAIAFKLAILGGDERRPAPKRGSATARIATLLGIYVLAITMVNFGSVVVQCGLGQCHTGGYALLR